ncbi:MAG: protein kinase domain-containing protein [Fusobacteriaceae bacterium]
MEKDKCKKGQACGYTCISKLKKCRSEKLSDQVNTKLGKIGNKSESFNFKEVLAEGAYGRVLIDRDKNVVQKIPKDSKFDLFEVGVGYIMGEKNFSPKIYKELSDENKITMDLVPGKTVLNYQRENLPVGENKVDEKISENLFEGLYYLQKELKVYHRDLHPGNVMVDMKNGQGKIIDYGLAKKITSEEEDLEIGLADWSDMEDFAYMPNTEKYKEIRSLSREYTELEKESDYIDEEEYDKYKKSLLKRYYTWILYPLN